MQTLMTLTCIRKGCGKSCPDGGLHCPDCQADRARQGVPQNIEEKGNTPDFPGRLTITLSWSALASDNLRTGIMGQEARDKQARYKTAKANAQAQLRSQYSGQPAAGPVRIKITVFVPDRRKRDGANFLKLINDSLKGIIVADDDFDVIEHCSICRGGVDADRPRAEITID